MKFWRHRKDEELDAEIRSHLDEAIRDRLARGGIGIGLLAALGLARLMGN